MTAVDNEDTRDQAVRRLLIREMMTSGEHVVLRAYPHSHEAGYAVYAAHRDGPVYACTLTTEPLPDGVVDSDIVTMDVTSPNPERTVMEWLAREFPSVSLENVQVERYEGPELTLSIDDLRKLGLVESED